MALPTRTKFLIIGAGIHGLSTAYHLAKALKARRQVGGADIKTLRTWGRQLAPRVTGIVFANSTLSPRASFFVLHFKQLRLSKCHSVLTPLPYVL